MVGNPGVSGPGYPIWARVTAQLDMFVAMQNKWNTAFGAEPKKQIGMIHAQERFIVHP